MYSTLFTAVHYTLTSKVRISLVRHDFILNWTDIHKTFVTVEIENKDRTYQWHSCCQWQTVWCEYLPQPLCLFLRSRSDSICYSCRNEM